MYRYTSIYVWICMCSYVCERSYAYARGVASFDFRVSGFGFRCTIYGFWFPTLECGMSSFGYRISIFRFWFLMFMYTSIYMYTVRQIKFK